MAWRKCVVGFAYDIFVKFFVQYMHLFEWLCKRIWFEVISIWQNCYEISAMVIENVFSWVDIWSIEFIGICIRNSSKILIWFVFLFIWNKVKYKALCVGEYICRYTSNFLYISIWIFCWFLPWYMHWNYLILMWNFL